ncbi:glycosyltransferase family 4 protein [Ornithinimicrobium pekingense]|uniref:Glycosyltransferase n=1 Tax=Ornithinimicrobium pekingense TaxID=384677 RepID=A0ABQ2FBT4_9MICO|nr:glycosyltransferase family 4 protein [Ornithinimicrobium pekingense]GGK73610.1 hypothetical protein GCM10011509_22790 [Ornithinimicrobium pekingense]
MASRDLQDLKLVPPPAEGTVLSTRRGQRLVVLAHDASDLYRSRSFLRGLTAGGHDLTLAWLEGELPAVQLPGARLPIRPRLARSPLRLARQVTGTPLAHWRGDRLSLLGAARLDPDLQRALARADAVVAFGDRAREVAEEVARDRCPVVPHADLAGWAALPRTWRQLRGRVRHGRLSESYARNLAERVAIMGGAVPAGSQGDLTELLEELLRTTGVEGAAALLPYLEPDANDPVETARRRAVAAALRTSVEGREDHDLRAAAAALITAADDVLETGDVPRTAALATLALRLLFHPELHSDGLSSPLVEDPETFLAAWRDSRVGATLAGSPSGDGSARRDAGPAPATGARPRVVVVPGSYPRFATQVTEVLRRHADVDVVDLASRGHLRGLAVRGELVEARLRQALGEDVVVDETFAEEVAGADAVFVDWADRGAVAALMTVPDGVAVTLRVHSMDALSPGVHLLDWGRVDDLVVVSDHLRDLMVRLVGPRLGRTRVHVVPNAVDTTRLPEGGKAEGADRTVLMIGWAQRVKDPVWALEVLAGLRAHDPAWRLLLVGPDFSPATLRSGADYVEEFRRRLVQPDVCGGVEFVGETTDVAPCLAAAGFVLSSSRRESFGLGLVEGAASGAVPVVRSWPIFAPLDGARRLFPPDWVVDTVEEAVRRVLDHASPQAWGPASAEARAEVTSRFLSPAPADRLAAVVLGGGG